MGNKINEIMSQYEPTTNQPKKGYKFGKILENEYEKIELLSASGGFSTVVKGINKKIKRVEAIKAIDVEGIEETGISMTQVEGEITIMGQLDHKNVVKIYNVIRKTTKYEDYIFIAMEFCDGTLSEIIRNNPKGVPRYEALGYLFQMIKGVAYLHREKILHRDLKPDNVFLKKSMVKIGDFNISKEQGEGIGTRTKPSQIILTYQYSPPERITGGIIDERVDSWAIGCIYYELLEGHMAFASLSGADLIDNIRAIKYPQPINATHFDKQILNMTLVPEGERKTVLQLKEFLRQNDEERTKLRYEEMEETKTIVGVPNMALLTKAQMLPTTSPKKQITEKVKDHLIISASHDENIIFWNNKREKEKRHTRGERYQKVLQLKEGKIVGASTWGDIEIFNQFSKEVECVLNTNIKTPIGLIQQSTKELIIGGELGNIQIWNLEEKRCRAKMKGGEERINCIIELNKGEIVTGGMDKIARIWSGRSLKCLTVLKHENPIQEMHEGDNNTLIVICGQLSATMKSVITLWGEIHTNSPKLLFQVPPHILEKWGFKSSLFLSSTQNLILGGYLKGNIMVYDLKGRKFIRTFKIHDKTINQLQLIGEGDIVTCSDDKTIKITGIHSGLVKQTLIDHTRSVTSVIIAEI